MTALQFEALGADRVTVQLAVMYVDHNVLQIDEKKYGKHLHYTLELLRMALSEAHLRKDELGVVVFS